MPVPTPCLPTAAFLSGPTAILEMVNGKGDLIYDHDRDEPKPTQIFPREKIEQLNTMLRQVVAAGTAQAAELDNTYVAGKTGTTSAFKDAWFIGYSGKYVTGIWFGNDESTPMNDVTGGRLVAPAWKNFMAALHSSVADVPAIPGLELHPNQIAEQQRLAELKKLAPAEGDKSGTLSEKSQDGVEADRRDLAQGQGGRPIGIEASARPACSTNRQSRQSRSAMTSRVDRLPAAAGGCALLNGRISPRRPSLRPGLRSLRRRLHRHH